MDQKNNGLGGLGDMINQMFQNPNIANNKPTPWWQAFSYPEVQHFELSNLMSFPMISLFFKGLLSNYYVMDEESVGKFNKASIDEYLNDLTRLKGKLAYSYSNVNHFGEQRRIIFVAFENGALFLNHSGDKDSHCNLRLLGVPELVEKIKELNVGFIEQYNFSIKE